MKMAYPFQGFPTFSIFLEWMKREFGWDYITKATVNENGEARTIVRILCGEDSISIASYKMSDVLRARDIGYLKRKLGIKKCHWESIDDDY